MSIQTENTATVSRWLTSFWGKTFDPGIANELADPDITLIYSLHEPLRGRGEVLNFMSSFRAAFSLLSFWSVSDPIAVDDCVSCSWQGRGVHTGPRFGNFVVGRMPQATGERMSFSGATVLRLKNGKIAEEIRLDDAETSLGQLKFLTSVPF